jgi:hypothetical protein
MRIGTLTLSALVLLSMGAARAEDCLAPVGIEAEQAIRFKTELMVVSELCRDGSYTSFLWRNADAVRDYQKQMIEFFARSGNRDGLGALDSFETKLANEAMLRHATVPTEVLCREKRYFLTSGGSLDADAFRRASIILAEQDLPSSRTCRPALSAGGRP